MAKQACRRLSCVLSALQALLQLMRRHVVRRRHGTGANKTGWRDSSVLGAGTARVMDHSDVGRSELVQESITMPSHVKSVTLLCMPHTRSLQLQHTSRCMPRQSPWAAVEGIASSRGASRGVPWTTGQDKPAVVAPAKLSAPSLRHMMCGTSGSALCLPKSGA